MGSDILYPKEDSVSIPTRKGTQLLVLNPGRLTAEELRIEYQIHKPMKACPPPIFCLIYMVFIEFVSFLH